MGNHQAVLSPLLELPIDIVCDFPVGDDLHLLDLGITKRLIVGYIEGTLGNVHAKWSSRETAIFSNYLETIKSPYEIRSKRAVRNLSSIKKWKAIEFKHFGLHVGIVLLKNCLRDYIYKHFVLYFCVLMIYSSEYHLQRFGGIADKCLKVFIERYKVIYGPQFFTSNVHNLLHSSSDVKRFGTLQTFSTYPFEGKLFNIGRLLRSGNLPLSQAAKRIIEMDTLDYESDTKEKRNPCFKKYYSSNLEELNNLFKAKYDLYLFLEIPKFTIHCDRDEDKWLLLKDMQILEVIYIVILNGQCSLYGQTLMNISDFLDLPVKSSKLLVFRPSSLCVNRPKLFSVNDVLCKMFKIKRDKEFFLLNDDDVEDDTINDQNVFMPLHGTITV